VDFLLCPHRSRELKKLNQIGRSTKGFVDICQKEAEWLISLGFKRKQWGIEPSEDSGTWLHDGGRS
jgi:hypothetical protein